MQADKSFADWLTCSGFPDRDLAQTASRKLDVPRLKPLWLTLQQRMCSSTEVARLQAYALPVKGSTSCDLSDPQRRLKKAQVDRLHGQLQTVSQQLHETQVSPVPFSNCCTKRNTPKCQCNLLQALLQQDMEKVLLSENRRQHQKLQTDSHYTQVSADCTGSFSVA